MIKQDQTILRLARLLDIDVGDLMTHITKAVKGVTTRAKGECIICGRILTLEQSMAEARDMLARQPLIYAHDLRYRSEASIIASTATGLRSRKRCPSCESALDQVDSKLADDFFNALKLGDVVK